MRLSKWSRNYVFCYYDVFFGYFIDIEVYKTKGLNLANSGIEAWVITIF